MKQSFIYSSDSLFQQRREMDRRDQKITLFFNYFYKGQRINARRQEELEQGFYVDRYDNWVVLVALSIILLSGFDAFFTLNILEGGGTEVNPVMLALLEYDTLVFLLGKMAITVTCVFFAFIHINFNVLRMFSVKLMMKSILVFYTFLIGYELCLLAIM